MSNIGVFSNYPCDMYKTNSKHFSGGELHVIVDALKGYINLTSITVTARLVSSDAIMELLLVTDALRRNFPNKNYTLRIGYMAYGRQDRVCNEGEAFGLKVVCDLINNLKYDKVYLCDPHSDVNTALLNNCVVIDQTYILKYITQGFFKPIDVHLVSPDAGANKKCIKHCKDLGFKSMIRADKTRDIKTGDITGTTVFCDDLKGEPVVIVDDICDGGRTFIELAKVLKGSKNAGKVTLVVTHGIFSNGFWCFEDFIDEIIYTDTFNKNLNLEKVNFGKGLSVHQIGIL